MADDYVHTVLRGDTVPKIADVKGVSEWNTVWNYNVDLQATRHNPLQLYTGDVVRVPIADKGEEPGAGESENPFQIPTSKLYLNLRLLREDYTALANTSYSLQVDGEPTPREGTTDDKGQLEITDLAAGVTTATVTVVVPPTDSNDDGTLTGDMTVTWNLTIGALHPMLEQDCPDDKCVPGVKQRLNNLGFNCGTITEDLDDATKAEIKRFCTKFGITEREEPDTELQYKIAKVHDNPDSTEKPV